MWSVFVEWHHPSGLILDLFGHPIGTWRHLTDVELVSVYTAYMRRAS
jgi:predicted dehydrogenase